MTDVLGDHLAKMKSNGTTPEPTTDVVPVESDRATVEALDLSITPPKVIGALPYASAYSRLAHSIAGTELVPANLRARPAAILAAFMYGYELGLPPMHAVNGIQIITGKAGLSAETMRALVMQSGHSFILSATSDKATVRCRRNTWPEGEWATFEWTTEDARRAGLIKANTNRSGWAKYPRAMLSARVTAEACRATFADVLHGMSYTPEEIQDFDSGPAPAPSPQAQNVTVTQSTPQEPVGDSDPSSSEIPSAGSPPDDEPAPVDTSPAPPAPAKRAAKRATPTQPSEIDPEDASVRAELRKGLAVVIKTLPSDQQTLVRIYLAQHGMGDLPALSSEELTKATTIAAGWPTSVRIETEEDTDDVVDAEVIGDDTVDDLAGEIENEELF